MSRFSGPQGRSARRHDKEEKWKDAVARQKEYLKDNPEAAPIEEFMPKRVRESNG